MLLMVNAALPVFLMVKVCAALRVFSGWLAKASAVADKLTAGPLAIPVPCNRIACGLPVLALSAMLAIALSLPAIEGWKVKLTVQLVPTARLLGGTGHVLVWVKSLLLVPVIVMLLKVSGAVPVLFITRLWTELTVPKASAGNDTLAWDTVAAGPGLGGTFNEDGKSRE